MLTRKVLQENMQKGVKYTFHGFLSGPFSNWYKADFTLDGVRYCCVEQAMMAAKARLMEDYATYKKIMATRDARKIKGLGRQVRNFDPKKWDEEKIKIVYNACYAKFTQNEKIKNILLRQKENILVECNPDDQIWGAGISTKSPALSNPSRWEGENLLGFILTEIKTQLETTK